jgi:hypothetical protein
LISARSGSFSGRAPRDAPDGDKRLLCCF